MNNEEIAENLTFKAFGETKARVAKRLTYNIKAALDAKDNQWISVESLDKETFEGASEVLAWNGGYYLLGYVYYDSHDNMFGCEGEGGFLFDVTHFYEPKPPTE